MADDEIEDAIKLFDLLSLASFLESEDAMQWSKVVTENRMQANHLGLISYPWKRVWFQETPPTINFLVWLVSGNRVLTLENLLKHKYNLANICVLCGYAEMTVRHLF